MYLNVEFIMNQFNTKVTLLVVVYLSWSPIKSKYANNLIYV